MNIASPCPRTVLQLELWCLHLAGNLVELITLNDCMWFLKVQSLEENLK